jgi:hypothetical protein
MGEVQADDARALAARGIRAFSEYLLTGRPEVLDVAVTAFQGAVAATPPGHPDLAWYLSNLGNSLRLRFERAGDIADLDAAVEAGRQAGDATPPGHPDRAMSLSGLGDSLRSRFEWAGDIADLDAAVEAGRQAVDATPPGYPDLTGYLSGLGSSLRSRFQRTGDIADLDAAVEAGWQAVDATPPDHPDLTGYLSDLGLSLRIRFERTGDIADLDAAIAVGRQAVDTTPPGHLNLAGYLLNLGGSLATRFERTGDIADLDAAIAVGRQAVDATPPGHPDRTMYLSNLGISLRTRFDRAGNTADLDAAIDASQQAVHLTPTGHPNLAMYLSNLGNSLLTRFDRAGNTADLDAAIDASQQAVHLTSTDHPNLAMYLSNLGNSLDTRFDRAGDTADLDAAIAVGRQAVDATPTGHQNLAAYLSGLGSSLATRFERAGDTADLDAAIGASRQAVDATPTGHPNLAMYLSNLGNLLLTRFDRAGDTADLDAAIAVGRQAVDATPTGHPNLAMYLSNLGNSLLTRFDRAGDTTDLDAAIAVGRQAVHLTPTGHPNLAMYLSNLGNSLLTRFDRAGDTTDLDAAIATGRQAVHATPTGHPNLAMYLSNLGISLDTRFERAGDTADLDAAIDCWRQASQVPAGTPRVRLAVARRWGDTAAAAGREHEAAEGYRVAVGMLPQVAWHGLNRVTREEHLAQWAGLAADAAACAVLDGRPELAVELLEQGRSVLWTQALNLRGDLSRLAEQAPELAGRLVSIQKVLDTPVPDTPSPPEPPGGSVLAAARGRQRQDAAELRRRMARDWDDVVAQVRALAGFEHFLAAIPYAELAAAAAGGPVVIVNASRYGCHALIADAGRERVRVVSLPSLSLDTAVDRANGMLRVLEDASAPGRSLLDREEDRHDMLDVLDWLWDVIAEPVLADLGHTSSPGTGVPWPRVRWCPTGPLTVLPIHAAGRYPRLRTGNTARTDCVPDRVISSYTPTLTALTRARQPIAPAPVMQLTVGMPATPGLPPLPAVPKELEVIARHFPAGEANHQLAGPQATRVGVLTAMASHSWVHLACHAGQQQADPDRSGFALWDGTLTITDLAAQPTQRRDLAFLSACQTATGSVRHLDEAIHLAAAMQFLGYRHVIATMWTIADSLAPQVADAVYTELTQDGSPEPARAADALHQAIRTLRHEDRTNNPLLWTPYIHLGN